LPVGAEVGATTWAGYPGWVDDEQTRPENEEVPKLTIGQRILTALPNLDRKSNGTRGSANAVRPAEVISPERPGPDEQETEDPGGPQERPARQSSSSARSQAARTSGKADPTANMSNEELQYAIKRIDDREQKYAMFAGPLGAAIGIALTAIAIHTNPAVGHKDHVSEGLILLEGAARIVLGALVVVAAKTRRRSFVAFALLFLGTADSFPFALLFWGLGGWMIWRVFRYQKALTARGAGPQRSRAAAGSRTAGGPRTSARAGATDARTRMQERKGARDRRRGKLPAATGPAASKRYTPRKPTRPRPPAPS
jgi:hypothetical protein